MNLPDEIELCSRPVSGGPCGQRLYVRADGVRYCRLHGDVGTEPGVVYVRKDPAA